MKQKYLILRSEDKSELIVREFAELDKDVMSLLCEETYDTKKIESAIKKNKDTLMVELRTPNMYPAGVCADKIADSVVALYESEEQESIEVFFDDFDYISTSRKRSVKTDKVAGEKNKIEDLLEEEEYEEEEFEEKNQLHKLDPAMDVDEENLTDFEEDT
jgi:hypothetical protein